MSVESELWRVRYLNSAYAWVTQKASGSTRMIACGALPPFMTLPYLSTAKFNAACRKAFHGE